MENYYYRKVGDHATNQISTIRYGEVKNNKLIIRDSVRYAYDSMGNITKVYENGEQTVSYEYDGIGRLKRENNRILGKTKVYAYDGNGNILTRREYAYTMKGEEELPEDYDEYTYGYEKGTDKLLEIESRTKNAAGEYEDKTERFVYDAIGNPTLYRGWTTAWEKGRRMILMYGINFEYNGRGQRINRKQGSANTFTYDASGNVVKESRGTEYFYDATGVCGMKYGESMYFYRKDVFGNITEILDSSGAVVVRYRYDAWGNHVVLNPDGSKNESDTFVGNINPFRYRGYYYDTTLKLYYLKTRYYDPEIGRFVTIDDVSYLAPETINGLNLYAYCGNNPVMRVDPTGTSFLLALLIGAIIGGVIGATISGVGAYQNGVRGLDLFGTILGGAIVGGMVGAIAGGLIWTGGTIIGMGANLFGSGLSGGLILSNGLVLGAGTATLIGIGSVAVGGIIVLEGISVAVEGINILYSEHTKNKRPSTRNKHEEGQASKKRGQRGGEKGDARRPYIPPKKKGNIILLILSALGFGWKYIIPKN